MSQTKPILGICGGIGSGKSQVAAAFGELGCLVIDSDKLNHEILRRPAVLQTLQSWWGPDVADAAGGPNRKRIAEIIFADGARKQRLESLVYPLIAALRADMILAGRKDPAFRAIILDSPLLFESNLDRLCDKIVFVEASEARRLQRLQQTRHWDARALQQRERWQKPLEFKRAHADFIVNNEGSVADLRAQAADILARILT